MVDIQFYRVPSFRAKCGGVPPPGSRSDLTLKLLLFPVNGFLGTLLNAYLARSGLTIFCKKVKIKNLSAWGKGGPSDDLEWSPDRVATRETCIFFVLILNKCRLLSGIWCSVPHHFRHNYGFPRDCSIHKIDLKCQ